MNKKGIVMELKKDKAGILTSSGEFVYIKPPHNMITLGECIEGSLIVENKNNTIAKRLSTLVASLLFIVFLSSGLFVYNQPVSAVTISINPAVKLKLNRWNRIISTDFINEDGKKVLSNLKLKNLDVEKGLNLIIEEAKKENFINESYIASSKTISIETEGEIKNFNVDNVKNLLEKDGLKYMIKNGEETKTNVEAINKDINPTESKNQPNSQVDNKNKNENINDDKKKQTTEGNENNQENIDKPNNPSNKPNENTNTNTNNENKANVKANENSNKNNNQDTTTKPENKNNSSGETKQNNNNNNNNNNKEKKKP